jgi:hypothetical protein
MYSIRFPGVEPELRRDLGQPGIRLSVIHDCSVLPWERDSTRWTIATRYYAYEILDLAGNELLTFHWHPSGESPITSPHLHLSSRVRPVELDPPHSIQGASRIAFAAMHIPTGRVLLEDVILLLVSEVEEFKIRPLRADWERVLQRNTIEILSDRAW